MVQLARAQARLANPSITDQLDHRLSPLHALSVTLLVLVLRLTAVPHVAASPCHAQPLDESLRKDLPKGFFTTQTP